MTNYSEYISEELARKLLNQGYHLLSYAPGTYDGAPCFDIPGPDDPGWADGDRYKIPTYGEVFDWFSSERGIVITLEPFHTFSLGQHLLNKKLFIYIKKYSKISKLFKNK